MFICLDCGNQMNPDELDKDGRCSRCHSGRIIEMTLDECMGDDDGFDYGEDCDEED